jgi:6-phosphogluconolactonase
MNLRVFDSLSDLAGAAAEELARRIEKDAARVIGLSGGSTPRSLYQILASEPLRPRLEAHPLIWVLEDERYVPPDHEDSNSRMIQQSLFAKGLPPGHTFLRFRTELNDPPLTARRFEEEWRQLNLQGLDLAVLGVGEDGHTASLFPGTDVLEVTERVATEVWVPRLSSWRVTMTLPYLRSAGFQYVLVSGQSKRDALERARRGEDLPITRVARGDASCWWLVDRDAYAAIERGVSP